MQQRINRLPNRFHGPAELYGRLGGLALGGFLRTLRATCHVERTGRPEEPGAIFCFWHRYVVAYVVATLDDRPRVTLFHPAEYMKPWLYVAHQMKWIPVMGSSGNHGRAAAEEVVRLLLTGFDFLICPDGPHGPPFELKRGVLEIARASGRPIVPIRFDLQRTVAMPSWDGHRIPVPRSRIRLEYGKPVVVRDASDATAEAIALAMGPPN